MFNFVSPLNGFDGPSPLQLDANFVFAATDCLFTCEYSLLVEQENFAEALFSEVQIEEWRDVRQNDTTRFEVALLRRSYHGCWLYYLPASL